jgi:Peptidase family S41/N-terminal domain of Peptidase_S41 in eukaryotic IRBP
MQLFSRPARNEEKSFLRRQPWRYAIGKSYRPRLLLVRGTLALAVFSFLFQYAQGYFLSSPSSEAACAVEDAGLDAAARRHVIDRVIASLQEYYVYPEVAQKMADALLAHQKSGDDDSVTEGAAFADLLTRQMRNVSHDKHLRLTYSVVKTPDLSGPPPEALARYRQDMERTNCMIEKVEVLPGNVGYLKLNEFSDPSICRSRVAAAMGRLRDVDAIIFDLRDNHGGDPRMVALVCSYLFDRPTHLNDMYDPRRNTTQESWASSPIPGNKLADKPAYILTSSSTFSGAEEFSYDLKMLKRATIVGETTGGGAHPAMVFRIDDHFTILVPSARPVNPVSKKDWEGTGVEPDVKVKAADALTTAQKLAAGKLAH